MFANSINLNTLANFLEKKTNTFQRECDFKSWCAHFFKRFGESKNDWTKWFFYNFANFTIVFDTF
jgi:hypothetical protein